MTILFKLVNIFKIITIIIIIISLSTLSLLASIWERVDGPYDYALIADIFEFNNQLFASSSSDSANYLIKDDKWNFTNINLPTSETILYFKQVDNNAIFSTVNYTYLTTNNGKDWKVMNPNLKNDYIGKINQAVFTYTKVFANLEYGAPKKLYSYDYSKDEWEVVKMEDGTEEVFSDYITKNGDYIISGSYGVSSDPKNKYGLFISSDNGQTWRKSTTLNVKVSSVILHNGIILVGGRDQNIYKSKDYGQTWEVDTNFIFPVDLFYSDGNNLYAGVNYVGLQSGIEVGIHLSTDNGETWIKRHNGIWGTNILKLLTYNKVLYCQDDRKNIFQTSDNGLNWEICQIMTDSLKSYDFLRRNDTIIVATSGKRGLYYSTEEGTKWNIYGNGFSQIVSEIYQKDSVYACIVNGDRTLNISKDNGKNWNNVDVGLFSNLNFIKDVELLGGDTLLIATILGTRYSTDFGLSWKKFHTEILDSNYDTRNIIRIDDNKLLLTAYKEGLFKSINNGQDWERVNTEFKDISESMFVSIELNNGVVYSYINEKGLFYSEDEGVTWNEYYDKIDKTDFYKDILIYNDYLLTTSPNGVFVSNKKNNSYQNYEIENIKNDSKGFVNVTSLEVQGEYLLVGSYSGIYKAKLSELNISAKSSVESKIERNYLYTFPPYPNPAKSEVKVLFYWDINLPMTTDDISIYDITGKKIDAVGKISLVKQESHFGNLIWDCSSAQPSIYLINIKHGTEEKAVKVVVE